MEKKPNPESDDARSGDDADKNREELSRAAEKGLKDARRKSKTRRAMTDPKVNETGTEARQGRTGRPVLIVLIAGLTLALLAWIGAEIWGGND